MSKVLTLLLFWSFKALACEPNFIESVLSTNTKQLIEEWGATSAQISSSFCTNPGKETIPEMLSFINRKPSQSKRSKNLFGIAIKNEDPRLIELLEKLLSSPSKKEYKVSTECSKVICAAEEIFGKDMGTKLLYALDKFGFNLSHHIENDRTAWNDEEIDLVIETLDDLPKTLIPYTRNHPLNHFVNGYTMAGYDQTTLAQTTTNTNTFTIGAEKIVKKEYDIVVFDPWNDKEVNEKKYTLIHEIGHSIGDFLDLDYTSEWYNLSGWTEMNDKWSVSRPETLVSEYSSFGPGEDFAEAFAAYRYNPMGLKKVSPEKYDFIKKNVFQGIEYTSEDSCKESKALINTLWSQSTPSPLQMKNGLPQCKEEISQTLRKKAEIESMRNCLSEKIIFDTIKSEIQKDPALSSDKLRQNALLKSGIDYLKKSPKLKVTDKEVKEAYVYSLEQLMNDLVKNYFGPGPYSNPSCEWETLNNYSYQNFKDSSFALTSEKYYIFEQKDRLNKMVVDICNIVGPTKKKLTCEDIVPYFKN